MNKRKVLLVNSYYLSEMEYKTLDVAMSSYSDQNPYSFISSIYNEGVIIFLYDAPNNEERDKKTKEDFPNLLKIIKLARIEGCDYVDLYEQGVMLPVDTARRSDLTLKTW